MFIISIKVYKIKQINLKKVAALLEKSSIADKGGCIDAPLELYGL